MIQGIFKFSWSWNEIFQEVMMFWTWKELINLLECNNNNGNNHNNNNSSSIHLLNSARQPDIHLVMRLFYHEQSLAGTSPDSPV